MGGNTAHSRTPELFFLLVELETVLVKVKGKSLRHVQLFVTPWTAAYRSSVHGISQARILEWVAISFSRSSRPRD